MTDLSLSIPDEVVDAIADLVVERVLAKLDDRRAAPELMTVPEVAELLRCSRGRVDNLLSAGALRRVKDGRRTLIARAEVEAYLGRATVPAPGR